MVIALQPGPCFGGSIQAELFAKATLVSHGAPPLPCPCRPVGGHLRRAGLHRAGGNQTSNQITGSKRGQATLGRAPRLPSPRRLVGRHWRRAGLHRAGGNRTLSEFTGSKCGQATLDGNNASAAKSSPACRRAPAPSRARRKPVAERGYRQRVRSSDLGRVCVCGVCVRGVCVGVSWGPRCLLFSALCRDLDCG